MRYSRWAEQNRHRVGINASEKEDEKVIDMSNTEKILDKVRERMGIKTQAQTERENAVRVLAGKQPQKQQLRPGVNQLLGRD